MALHRLAHQLFSLVRESDLNRLIAVVLNGFDLRYHAGACLKHGYGSQCPILCKDLRHTNLCRQNCFLHVSSLSALRASST